MPIDFDEYEKYVKELDLEEMDIERIIALHNDREDDLDDEDEFLEYLENQEAKYDKKAEELYRKRYTLLDRIQEIKFKALDDHMGLAQIMIDLTTSATYGLKKPDNVPARPKMYMDLLNLVDAYGPSSDEIPGLMMDVYGYEEDDIKEMGKKYIDMKSAGELIEGEDKVKVAKKI